MIELPKKRLGHPRDVARRVLGEYFDKHPPISLPVPIDKIAEANGFEIIPLDSLDKNHRAILQILPEENRKLIGLNTRYRRHNHRFSIGHELGHYFLGHPVEDDSSDEEVIVFDREADEFSAELLIPLAQLKDALTKLKDVKALARLFDVSEEALWRKIDGQHLLSLLSK